MELIDNTDVEGLGLEQHRSPPSSPQFPSGGDADGDTGSSGKPETGEVLS